LAVMEMGSSVRHRIWERGRREAKKKEAGRQHVVRENIVVGWVEKYRVDM